MPYADMLRPVRTGRLGLRRQPKSKPQAEAGGGSGFPAALQRGVLEPKLAVGLPAHARWLGREVVVLEGTKHAVTEPSSDQIGTLDGTVIISLGLRLVAQPVTPPAPEIPSSIDDTACLTAMQALEPLAPSSEPGRCIDEWNELRDLQRVSPAVLGPIVHTQPLLPRCDRNRPGLLTVGRPGDGRCSSDLKQLPPPQPGEVDAVVAFASSRSRVGAVSPAAFSPHRTFSDLSKSYGLGRVGRWRASCSSAGLGPQHQDDRIHCPSANKHRGSKVCARVRRS